MDVLVLCLVVAALAVARLATLVAEDEITMSFRRWVIKKTGADSLLTRLVHCAPWCMSMWFGLIMPVAVLWPTTWLLAILSPLAGSMFAATLLTAIDRKS